MPSPDGAPLKSVQIFPDGDKVRLVYEYEDGERFETQYNVFALVGREACSVIDTEPPFKFNTEKELYEPAW